MVKVLRADRSPLNKRQWLCELECGHEQWVTSARKPSKVDCYECKSKVVATPNNASSRLACTCHKMNISGVGEVINATGCPVHNASR